MVSHDIVHKNKKNLSFPAKIFLFLIFFKIWHQIRDQHGIWSRNHVSHVLLCEDKKNSNLARIFFKKIRQVEIGGIFKKFQIVDFLKSPAEFLCRKIFWKRSFPGFPTRPRIQAQGSLLRSKGCTIPMHCQKNSCHSPPNYL